MDSRLSARSKPASAPGALADPAGQRLGEATLALLHQCRVVASRIGFVPHDTRVDIPGPSLYTFLRMIQRIPLLKSCNWLPGALPAIMICSFISFILLSHPVCAADPARQARIVFMIGEDEYLTWETLPEFARTELKPARFKSSFIQSNEKDPNDFPGLSEALASADLLVLSTRRRTPLKGQLDAVREYLKSGKPLVGVRTASHAFARRGNDPQKLPAHLDEWPEFDPEVLGGRYTGHYGAGTKTAISVAPGAETNSILSTIDVSKLQGNGSLYKVSPLGKSATPLLLGTIPGNPPEPVAWVALYGTNRARIFYTSLGHPDDFKNPVFRRLLLNGIDWALNRPLLLARLPEYGLFFSAQWDHELPLRGDVAHFFPRAQSSGRFERNDPQDN